MMVLLFNHRIPSVHSVPQANVIVLVALDPRVVVAAIESDMEESMRREVCAHCQPYLFLLGWTIIRLS